MTPARQPPVQGTRTPDTHPVAGSPHRDPLPAPDGSSARHDALRHEPIGYGPSRAAAEVRFSALAELAPVGLFETDAAGGYLFVNASWCELAGLTPEEAAGDGWTRAVMQADLPRVVGEWRTAVESGALFQSEFRFHRADDSVLWLKGSAVPRRGRGGRVAGYVGSVTDVSDRRLREEELRESRQRLLEAQYIGGMGNWESDLALRATFWSPQLYRLWGRAPSEGPPSTEEMLELVLPDDRAAVAEAYGALRDRGEAFAIEYRMQRPDGDIRAIVGVGTLLLEGGRPSRLAGTLQDVSDRREVEEALRARDAELRSLYDSSPLMMGIVELAGEDVLHVSENPATTRFFGTLGVEAGQRLTSEMGMPPELTALWVRRYREAVAARRPVRFEYRHQLPGGSRWLSATVCPIETAPWQRPRCAYVMEDATERKRAEEQLAVQADELARSNRELEQFAYVASHDLQEPLRTMSSFAQLLATRYQGRLDPDADDFLGFITDGAVRMRALITDLLSYARVSAGREPAELVEIASSLQAAISSLTAAIDESGARISAGPLPTLSVLPAQLEQLFLNLLGNAIKFAGPRVPSVRVSAELAGGAWIFTVADDGIGIAPEYAERIFEIFQRLHTRAEYTGTGIGLALCRRIVEEHGGRIWVESRVGEGATFRFTLPVDGRAGR